VQILFFLYKSQWKSCINKTFIFCCGILFAVAVIWKSLKKLYY